MTYPTTMREVLRSTILHQLNGGCGRAHITKATDARWVRVLAELVVEELISFDDDECMVVLTRRGADAAKEG